jgi:hypothetical protein
MDGFDFLIMLGALAAAVALAMIDMPARDCSREPD